MNKVEHDLRVSRFAFPVNFNGEGFLGQCGCYSQDKCTTASRLMDSGVQPTELGERQFNNLVGSGL